MKTKSGILNFLTVYIFYFIIAVLSFIKLRWFLNYLGENIYSLNQLYTSIFSYLSLLEGGMGTALVYKLYKLLDEKDYDGINKLYSGTVYIFRVVGLILIMLGILISFFIPIFIKNNPFSLIFLVISFTLYVLKSCFDYFFFIPRYIIAADNNSYKINLIVYGLKTLELLIEMALIHLGYNYIVVLIPSVFLSLVQNYLVNRKIYRLYPWLKYTKDRNMEVKDDVKNIMAHRLSTLVFNNTDVLILSSLVGSKAVVIYSGYNYIIKYAVDSVIQFFQAIRDGVGQIINGSDLERKERVIEQTNTIFSFIADVLIVVLFFVLNDFVNLWLGGGYAVSNVLLVLFLLILYHKITNRSHLLYVHTLGLFGETKKYVYIIALINISCSLLFVFMWGINGVVLATIIAMYSVEIWCYGYIAAKKVFNKFDIKLWLGYHLKNLVIILSLVGVMSLIPYFRGNCLTWGVWIIKSCIMGVISLILILILFNIWFKEMRYIEKRIINTIKEMLIRRRKNA